MEENKIKSMYVFLILPLVTFSKYYDGTKEITFGWLKKTYSIRF